MAKQEQSSATLEAPEALEKLSGEKEDRVLPDEIKEGLLRRHKQNIGRRDLLREYDSMHLVLKGDLELSEEYGEDAVKQCIKDHYLSLVEAEGEKRHVDLEYVEQLKKEVTAFIDVNWAAEKKYAFELDGSLRPLLEKHKGWKEFQGKGKEIQRELYIVRVNNLRELLGQSVDTSMSSGGQIYSPSLEKKSRETREEYERAKRELEETERQKKEEDGKSPGFLGFRRKKIEDEKSRLVSLAESLKSLKSRLEENIKELNEKSSRVDFSALMNGLPHEKDYILKKIMELNRGNAGSKKPMVTVLEALNLAQSHFEEISEKQQELPEEERKICDDYEAALQEYDRARKVYESLKNGK